MHYNNCLKRAEVTSPDTSGLSTLVRRNDVVQVQPLPLLAGPSGLGAETGVTARTNRG